VSNEAKLEVIKGKVFLEYGFNLDNHNIQESRILARAYKSDELRLFQLRKMYSRRLRVFSHFLDGDDKARAQSTIKNLENKNV